MMYDYREVAMRLGQLEPCEHHALLKIGGESLIRREIQGSGPELGVARDGLPLVSSLSTHAPRTTCSHLVI
jgi:hypothetical protein